MDFYDFVSEYDRARRGRAPVGSAMQFYRGLRAKILQSPVPEEYQGQKQEKLDRCTGEEAWVAAGEPYYKAWPGVIPILSEVEAKVPVEYLRLPFPAFLVRFPKEENPLITLAGRLVESCLVYEGADEKGMRCLWFWFHYNPGPPEGRVSSFKRPCHPNAMIQDDYFSPTSLGETLDFNSALSDRCVRLAISICLLSTGADRLIEPDVLSKELADWLEARERDPERAERIVERSHRKGKKGWNVGRRETARPFLSRPTSEPQGETGHRGPLHHQHQRRAHFRVLPSKKVVFVRQTTIRPDLPPPDLPPGYNVR